MNQERFEALMVKVVDQVATPAEREELMAWLADKPELARELESHQAIKAVTDGWVDRLMLDLAQDRRQREAGHRAAVGFGLGALLVSVLLLVGWGLGAMFLDPEVPLAVQLGTGGLALGSLVLLVVVIRWRLKNRKHDKYSEVVR